MNLSALRSPFKIIPAPHNKNDASWPSLLGREGVGGIVLWGLACASVAQSYAFTP